MKDLNNISIGTNYKELIGYLHNIGHKSTVNYTEKNVFIQVRNNEGEQYLQFRLDYCLDTEGYNCENLQVAWKLLGYSGFSTPHRFPKDMNQKVIFEIIMFEIINWKLQHIDDLVIKTINKTLDSDSITNWLKTKEEQIRIEERTKIENHFSVEEFRKVMKEELGKININFKIGTK